MGCPPISRRGIEQRLSGEIPCVSLPLTVTTAKSAALSSQGSSVLSLRVVAPSRAAALTKKQRRAWQFRRSSASLQIRGEYAWESRDTKLCFGCRDSCFYRNATRPISGSLRRIEPARQSSPSPSSARVRGSGVSMVRVASSAAVSGSA